MSADDEAPDDARTDDRTLDGGTPDDGTPNEDRPDEDAGNAVPRRVTFGAGAVAVGFLVGLVTLALVFALPWGADAPGVFVLALWYGLGIGLVTGLPLGILVGLLLRSVTNQWVHIGVFFAAFTLVPLVLIALLSPSRSVLENLPVALIIGGVGAFARASVWKLVRVQ
ncbi:hypothetical protein MN0502_04230 [Arthrobacter sp. MN05-02]|nr:hypothetical protein MN0502_04230 [Arthrobacter sp. MN05-02]